MANMEERAKTVMAMERLARCINHEGIMESWYVVGVADGDITAETTPQDVIDLGYCEDDTFKDLMTLFLKLMRRAGINGGLYEGGIVSGVSHLEWD